MGGSNSRTNVNVGSSYAMRSFLSLSLLSLGVALGQFGANARGDWIRTSGAGGRMGFLRTPAHPIQQQQGIILSGLGAAAGAGGRSAATSAGSSSGARCGWGEGGAMRRRDGQQPLRMMAAAVEGEDRLSLGAPRYRPLSVGDSIRFRVLDRLLIIY